jgi:hypothetical protein
MKKLLIAIISATLCITTISGCGTTSQTTAENTIQTSAPEISSPHMKYVTYENNVYTITLQTLGKTIQVNSAYNEYMLYVNDDILKEAEESIYSQISGDTSQLIIYLKKEYGVLYLTGEAIVYIDHPEGVGGCNIDHKHIFFSEPRADKE